MSTIIMILLISILILVHEAGHFFSARMFKIKVDKFGIGLPIGPTLWEKKIGDIVLVIHAFLFGGYVSFPDDDKESEIPPDSKDRLLNRPIWQRAIVFSAGVAANVLCAFVLVLLTAFLWHNMPSGKFETYVKDITAEKDASVWQSGLQQGDKITEINGSEVDTKYGIYLYAMHSASYDGKAPQKLIDDNYAQLKKINPAFEHDEIIERALIVTLPNISDEGKVELNRNVLNAVELYKADDVKLSDRQIQLRDEIQNKKFIEADGTFSLDDLSYAMSDNVKPLDIKVERNGRTVELKTLYANKDGLIGIVPSQKEILIPVTSIKTAFTASWNYLYNETKSMIIVLGQLFSGKIPLKNMHGVVLITKMGGDIISHDGIFYGILLTAVISMNLAIKYLADTCFGRRTFTVPMYRKNYRQTG